MISKNSYGLPFICVFLAALLLATGCRKAELIRPGDTIEVAFNKSMTMYENGRYDEAVRGFEAVIKIGRGTEYAQQAQFYLAESYFNTRSYLLAASEYERYVAQFPRSDKREEAYFKEALCYYRLSPRYNLDQQYTRRAIEKFRLYNSRYPNSERTQQAAEHISELRSKLAKELYYSADLYMRTDRYEAAALYYGLTIDRYPETEWAERALVNQINTYVIYAENSVQARQEERYLKAVESYEKLLQLFPRSQHRYRAEEYVDKARVALAELTGNESVATDTTSRQ